VVMTSATLGDQPIARHFKQRHGAEEAEEAVIGSPFDYARQMQLFIPKRCQIRAMRMPTATRSSGGCIIS